MPRKTIVVVASILLLALASSSFSGQGRAVEETPVIAAFTDNADDNIRSDGGGAYQNGVTGVRALIDSLDDLILQLHFAGNKNLPRRRMFFDFTEPVPGSGSGAINRGTFYDDAFLNVDSIGTLEVGQSRSAQAQFNTEIGLLRFNPAKYPGTSYVLVTRTSDTTWDITASSGTGGDVAALVEIAKGNSIKHLGNYHMPFQITVQLQ
jgi:hypothetical protein